MPGYSERTRRLDFPELGADVWVVIRNPLLLPLEPDEWDGLTVAQRGRARYVRWIASWNLPDPASETDELLGPPSDDTVARAPSGVLRRVLQEVADWGNPLAPTKDNSNTGSTSLSPPTPSSAAPGPETTSPESSPTSA